MESIGMLETDSINVPMQLENGIGTGADFGLPHACSL